MSKMFLSTWFMSIVAVLAVDTRTGALQHNEVELRMCHQCPLNSTKCEDAHVFTRLCPSDHPYCATIAAAPNFTSLLTCTAVSDKTCTLMYSERQTYEMTCVCNTNLCNAPFSQRLQKELINFSTSFVPKNVRDDLTALFWKSSSYGNSTNKSLYKIITNFMAEATVVPTQYFSKAKVFNKASPDSQLLRHSDKFLGPRVEALRHEATEPSDDEEDSGEGSGAEEDTLAPAPAPAVPSAHLPAGADAATHYPEAAILFNSFITATLLFSNIAF